MDSASLLGQLQQAQNSTPSAADLFNQASAKYGLPEVRSQVSGLRTTLANTQNAINNVAPSVATRSQGSLVTGGQQSALGNLERQPLDQAYNQENTSLTNRNADLTSLLGQATDEANLGYKAGQDKLSQLKDLYGAANQREQAARDEAFRQAQLTEATAARKASGSGGLDLSGLLGGAASAGGSPTTGANKVDPLAAAIDYANTQKQVARQGTQVPTFFREGVLKQLQHQYGSYLTPQQINEIVYKQVFPDNWNKR